nr:3738_t:CDS:2 [Entrophospora candida]
MQLVDVKHTYILGSLDLLDKAGKYNIEDLSSEEFSNSFPVNTTPASKDALDGSNSTSSQGNKKTKTGENWLKKLLFKKIFCIQLPKPLIHSEMLNFLNIIISSRKYGEPAKQNSEGYSDSEGVKDEIISEMKKEVCNLDGLIAKFQYLSHALPISLKQYNELLYPEIYIIKSIASHLSTITKMERITDNTME